MTSSPIVYLDQGIEVWGSGYNAFEPVQVEIQIGGGQTASLGNVEANGGGAFRMVLTADDVGGMLDAQADRLIAEGALTLMGIGADGSIGSTAIAVVAEAPEAEAAPSVAASMSVGTVAADGSFTAGGVAEGGELYIVGAGFLPNEHAGMFRVKHVAGSSLTETAISGTSLAQLGTAVTDKAGTFALFVPSVSLEEGFYTVQAVGIFGTIATAPLFVTAAAE